MFYSYCGKNFGKSWRHGVCYTLMPICNAFTSEIFHEIEFRLFYRKTKIFKINKVRKTFFENFYRDFLIYSITLQGDGKQNRNINVMYTYFKSFVT